MSKAILEIDMPECCADCPCSFFEGNAQKLNLICGITQEEANNVGKPEWCPLKIKDEKSTDTIEKIKDIIKEEEHYPVSNSLSDPHPNEHDYNKVHADKFNRIWKVIADAESGAIK